MTTLTRLIVQVCDRTAARVWRMLAPALNDVQRNRLEGLLVVPDSERHSPLDRLRQGPTRVSGPALVAAIDRLEEIRAIGVTHIDLDRVPPSRVKALARYAASAWAPTIARMSDERRLATLLASAKTLEVTALDDALDLFDVLVTEILAQAKRIWEKERLRTIRDLDAAALTLRDACRVLLDGGCDDSAVRHQAFARVSKDELLRAVMLVETLARPSDDRYYKEIVDRYRRVRYFLPRLLHEKSTLGQTRVVDK